MERVADQEVQHDDQKKWQRGQAPVRQSLPRFLRLIEHVMTIAFALCLEFLMAITDPAPGQSEIEHGTDEAEHRSRPGRCAEERRRDDVLDLRRTGDGHHAVGEDAHPQEARQQPLRDIRLLEEDGRERVHDKGDDEDRQAAVRQDTAAEQHGQDGLVASQSGDNLVGHSCRKSALLHDLGKDSAEQEDGIIRLDVLRGFRHIDLTVDRHGSVAAADGGDDGKNRCDEDDGIATIREEHQKYQAEDDHTDAHRDNSFLDESKGRGEPAEKKGSPAHDGQKSSLFENLTPFGNQICAFSLMYLRALIAYSSGLAFAGSCSASTMNQPS